MTVHLSVRAVVEAVSDVTGFATADIIGRHRHRDLMRARQLAMWCCKQYCPHLSYPQIGRRFGARDHTTVLHGVTKISAEIEAQGKDQLLQAIELVLAPAAQALDLLQIQAADPDPMEIAERAMTEHGVARITYDEIRAMAQFVQAAIIGGQLVVDPPEPEPELPPEPLSLSNALLLAARRVVMAHRDLQSARYGRGEVSALSVLAGAVSDLQAAYVDLGYSIATPNAFKPSTNAPRREANNA